MALLTRRGYPGVGRFPRTALPTRTCVAPARIACLTDQGQADERGVPRVGAVANLVLVDPQARRTVDPEQHLTKSRNSPYRGMELPGAVRHTVYRGARVVADGAPARPYRHPALTETGERA